MHFHFSFNFSDNNFAGYVPRFTTGSNVNCANHGYNKLTSNGQVIWFESNNGVNVRCHWSFHAPNAQRMKIYLERFGVSNRVGRDFSK